MKRLALQFVVGIALAAALLAYSMTSLLSGVEGDDVSGWSALWEALSSVPLWTLFAYAATFLVVHVVRVWRWVVQVRPLGEPDDKLVFRVCAIGYAAIVAFPFRLGELVRPYLLARESRHVAFAEAMGTAVVERIFDGLFITALLFLAVGTSPYGGSPIVRSAGVLSLAVFSSATIGLLLFAWQRRIAKWLLGMTFGLVDRSVARFGGGRSLGLEDKVEGLIEGFFDGLRSLRQAGTLLPFVLYTLLYWGVNAFGIWLLARAYGLDIPLYAGPGLLAVLVVGIMVPSGPGLVGTFQISLAEGLKLYLPAAALGASALAFALVMNGIQLIIQIGFAVPFLARSGLGVRDVVELQQAASANVPSTEESSP